MAIYFPSGNQLLWFTMCRVRTRSEHILLEEIVTMTHIGDCLLASKYTFSGFVSKLRYVVPTSITHQLKALKLICKTICIRLSSKQEWKLCMFLLPATQSIQCSTCGIQESVQITFKKLNKDKKFI
jgi:hypothetical protein